VEIQLKGQDDVLEAFSRNISANGVGLLTNHAIDERAVGKVIIFRPDGKAEAILSECRWCKNYGEKWFLSGWQFINVARS